MDISIISDLTSDDLTACTELYESAFPAEERRSTEEWKRYALERSEFHLHAIHNEEHQCCGFISFWEFEDFAYVEHFALHKSVRGRGIGSQVFRTMLDRFEKRDLITLLEVEPPTNELTRSRIRFYEHIGMYLLPYDYIQPPYAPHLSAIPLRLMCSTPDINEERIKNCVMRIHETVYGV